MKRKALIRHLTAHGCELIREGGNHSWWSEVDDLLVKKICKDLGIPAP